jgi:hypothetical protein
MLAVSHPQLAESDARVLLSAAKQWQEGMEYVMSNNDWVLKLS